MLSKRKDGRWQKSVTVDGKRKFYYSSEPTEARAERDIARQMGQEHVRKLVGQSFRQVAEEWWDSTENTLSVQTLHGYRSAYKYCIEYFGDTPIKEITLTDVNKFLQSLAFKGLSKGTVQNTKVKLHLIIKFAIINGYTQVDPCLYAKLPKMRESLPREAASNEEEQIVLKASDKDCIAFKIALLAGLRKGEIYGLRWEDIDFEKNIIHVRRSIGWDDSSRPVVKDPKTITSIREVPLLPQLKEIFLKKIGKSDKKYYIISGKVPYPRSKYDRMIASYKKKYGVKSTLHQFRHSFATIALENGVPMKTVSEILGHSNISITANIYTHVRKASIDDAASKLSMAFSAK